MTTESNNKPEQDITPEQLADEIVQQAEEQVEKQQEHAKEVISLEQELINELKLAVATAQSTVSDQKDSVIRAKAEVDNIRRRAALDVEKARKFALEKFAGEMLTTVDNLERALQSIDKEDESKKGVIEGIELTLQGLTASLEKFGITYNNYHTTHSAENKQLSSEVYLAAKSAGYIYKEEIEQCFDQDKQMFLADRYVTGECPKCSAQNQYGDGCDSCGVTYSATELVNPKSTLTGSTPTHKLSLIHI